ncbi:MAG: acyl-CoA dehydrogenase family protein [bacterium]|nr:acyl-CoA dehydrogenase family protein [bacterium]
MPERPDTLLPRPVRDRLSELPAGSLGPDTSGPDTDGVWRARRRVARALGQTGLLAMHWPASLGGRAADLPEVARWRELVALAGLHLNHAIVSGLRWIGAPVLAFGTPRQKAEWGPPVALGDWTCALAVTEEQAGSDLGAIATRADRIPGGYRLGGDKARVSFAHRVSHLLVLARTETLVRGVAGLTAFMMPARARGLTWQRRPTAGCGHPLFRARFREVRLEDAWRIGEPGQGFEVLHEARWSGDTPVERAALFIHSVEHVARDRELPDRRASEEAIAELRQEALEWRRLAWHAVHHPEDADLERWWNRHQEAERWLRLGDVAAARGAAARARALWAHAGTLHAGTTVEGFQRLASLGRYDLWDPIRG